MGNYAVGTVHIKNTTPNLVCARLVVPKTKHFFWPGHFTSTVPSQGVITLNLAMMSGMGGPDPSSTFYVEAKQPGTTLDFPRIYTGTEFVRRGDAAVWFKAIGADETFNLEIYPAPTEEDIALASEQA